MHTHPFLGLMYMYMQVDFFNLLWWALCDDCYSSFFMFDLYVQIIVLHTITSLYISIKAIVWHYYLCLL